MELFCLGLNLIHSMNQDLSEGTLSELYSFGILKVLKKALQDY